MLFNLLAKDHDLRERMESWLPHFAAGKGPLLYAGTRWLERL